MGLGHTAAAIAQEAKFAGLEAGVCGARLQDSIEAGGEKIAVSSG